MTRTGLLRRSRANFLIVLGSLVISFAGAEVAFRFFGKNWTYSYPPVCPRPDLFEQNDVYGYHLWPSRAMQYSYPREHSRTLSLVSNADGFRSSREFHERDPRARVVVVGDSFVFGEGVEESERFTNVLEGMEPKWRVDNLGMTGYGPDLMYRALEAVGLEPVPDVVVFAIYTDDFRRVDPQYSGVGFPIPRFELQSGRLVTVPYPAPRFWERSRLFEALRSLRLQHTNALFDLNEAILDRFLQLATQRHFAPGFIFLPGRTDTPADERHRSWLKTYAGRHGAAFLDLTEPLRKAGTQQVYILGNWHLNPRGHEVVAAELRRFIADEFFTRGECSPSHPDGVGCSPRNDHIE